MAWFSQYCGQMKRLVRTPQYPLAYLEIRKGSPGYFQVFKILAYVGYTVTDILVRERSALATLIITSRVCLSFVRSVCLSVRNFGAKYLGNKAR